MPSPCDYDDEDDFHSDCVAERQRENPDESVEQSNAACYGMWEDRDCDKSRVYKQGDQSEYDPFEFVMSTSSVDRVGDVVEQDWNLKSFRRNPIALYQHDASQPIGVWERVRVEKDRLVGRLRLARAGTSDIIDTIRSLLEQRILKAVSVGFRPTKAVPMDEDEPWKGYRLSGNELLECSLVSVPANPEALSLAKTLDAGARRRLFATCAEPSGNAACVQLFGRSPDSDEQPVSKPKHKRTPTMSLSQKIEKKQEQIAKLNDQLVELEKDYDAEEDMPTEVTEQIVELTDRIDKTRADLEVLRRAETALVARAAVQAGSDSQPVVTPVTTQSVQRIEARVNRKKGFRSIATLSALLKAHVDKVSPVSIAEGFYKDDPEIGTLVKAATAPADMTTPGWAAELVRETWGEFLDLIRDMSVFPNLPGMRLEFDRYGKITIPRNQGRGALSGGWVAEGAPIPVKQGVYDDIDLEPKQLAVISTFTRKIANHSMPAIQGLVQNQILGDTAEQLDTNYLDAVARSATRPAGMQDTTETGAGNINAATGATVAAIIADLKGMIQRFLAARAGNGAVWIMSPLNVLNLRSVQDAASGEFVFRAELDSGTLFGYPLLVSQNVPTDLVVLQGAQAVAYGNDNQPVIDVSDEATIVFDDTAPEDIVSGGTATTQPVKSMFQTLSVAIRMYMGLDWRIVRTGGVQVLTGVAWS